MEVEFWEVDEFVEVQEVAGMDESGVALCDGFEILFPEGE